MYIKGTINFGLVYKREIEKDDVIGYLDSNHARYVNDTRSTGRMAFYLNKNLITWASQKQRCVAFLSCEAQFMAATSATCQGISIHHLLSEIMGGYISPIILYIDNKSAINPVKNLVFHRRSKHIVTRYQFIRECIERGDVIVKFVCNNEKKVVIFTKLLGKMKFVEMRNELGVKNTADSGLRGRLLV